MITGIEINEHFLHFIWQFRLFNYQELQLINGLSISIEQPGLFHSDSGPDFRHARIRIDGVLWAGNVEMHLRSSDWFRHGHHKDAAYDSVILHVVWKHDIDVPDKQGIPIQVLELNHLVSTQLLDRWKILHSGMFAIPCAEIGRIDVLTMHNWLDRLVIERLEVRSDQIRKLVTLCKQDWQEAFHVFLSRAMGMHVNSLPFELLARKVPFKLIVNHRHSRFQMEALLFGQSGLLPEESVEDYPNQLKEEYRFLASKYRLFPLEGHLWKFLRMRPGNFPTIRIAQLAEMHQTYLLTPDRFCDFSKVSDMLQVFHCDLSPYWKTHYSFSKESSSRVKSLGSETARGLLINAVIPFIFEYASYRTDSKLRERCLEWMYDLQSEKNHVVREWGRIGIQPESAAGSQALLHLKRNYCESHRCLDCAVGHQLLKDACRSKESN